MKTCTTSAKSYVKWLVAALWLLVWQGACLLVGEELLLSSPASVARRLFTLALQPDFWGIVGTSLSRILLGFLLGLLFGTVIAATTARSRALYAFFSLPMSIIKSTPVASFVILAYVWISGKNMSVFISFLMVLPLIWSNVDEGIRATDPKLLEMAAVFRLPRRAVLKNITVPAVFPYFLSAARVGLGFSWKSGIAGEVIAIPTGSIGTQLYNAKVYLETTDIFAWTAVIILLSVLLERLMVAGVGVLARRLNRLTREVEA